MKESQTYIKILEYLESDSRNKLVIHREKIESVSAIDVGKQLAAQIKLLVGDVRLSMKAKVEIEKLFNSSITNHPDLGKILPLKNIGILFEPKLKIDINNLLDRFSKENTLFLHWEGVIENENLYFLTKDGIKISIKNLSHIVL